ncbi:LysM peptidoglycan-binding domain-containing protein [bacterium]|nr:LysM peptidoglycan-binding domain-containing protein [bacterium]
MTFPDRILAGALVLVWVFFLVPHDLVAGEVVRKVGSGDSLSLICQEVYGEKGLYTLVALYNGKDDPTKISLGETLRLPYSDTVTLQSGESLSMLAKRVWGEAKMYPVLAWANGVHDAAVIPVGTRLAVPVLIPYILQKGQSVSSVAGDIYGNPKVYEVILNASRITDPTRVPAGTLLKIPYVMPRPVVKKAPVRTVRKPAPKPAPKPTPKPVVTPVVKKPEPDLKTEKAMNLLGKAEGAFREGRYGDAWTMGNGASRDLAGKDKAKALRLMASSQYAFGRTDEALDALKRAHELDPEFVPDPAYVNPEMMVLYKKAGR